MRHKARVSTLTLRNILVDDPSDITSVKLIDFGLCIKYDDHCSETNYLPNLKCGTELYMAPEVVQKETYTKSVDIWSLGITLYYLISGRHPFHKKGDPTTIFKQNLIDRMPLEFGPEFSSLVQDFISKLCHFKSNLRYNAD